MKYIILSSLIMINLLGAFSLDDAIQNALVHNNDIKNKIYEQEIAEENIKLSKVAFKPSLDTSYYLQERKEDFGLGTTDSSASVSLTYNLYNGFKDFYSLKSVENLGYSEELALKIKKLDIIYNTKVAFINYLKNQKDIETMQHAYELFQTQYQNANNKFEQGLLAKNELLQINVQMLQSKQNLASSKSNAKVAKYKLKNILGQGFDINDEVQDLVKEEFDSIYNIKDLENKLEIKVLQTLQKSIQNQKKSNNSGYHPSIDVSAEYTKYFERTTFNSSTKDEQTAGSLSVSWNLYSGGKYSYQKAKLNKQLLQLANDLTQIKLQINLTYQEAIDKLEVSKLNYKTAQISLDQAKENYSLVEARLKEGLLSSTDLIDANYLLSKAKQNLDNAYYDIFLADAFLQRLFERAY